MYRWSVDDNWIFWKSEASRRISSQSEDILKENVSYGLFDTKYFVARRTLQYFQLELFDNMMNKIVSEMSNVFAADLA